MSAPLPLAPQPARPMGRDAKSLWNRISIDSRSATRPIDTKFLFFLGFLSLHFQTDLLTVIFCWPVPGESENRGGFSVQKIHESSLGSVRLPDVHNVQTT